MAEQHRPIGFCNQFSEQFWTLPFRSAFVYFAFFIVTSKQLRQVTFAMYDLWYPLEMRQEKFTNTGEGFWCRPMWHVVIMQCSTTGTFVAFCRSFCSMHGLARITMAVAKTERWWESLYPFYGFWVRARCPRCEAEASFGARAVWGLAYNIFIIYFSIFLFLLRDLWNVMGSFDHHSDHCSSEGGRSMELIWHI